MRGRAVVLASLAAAFAAAACSRSEVAAPQAGAAADTVAEHVPPGATSDVPDPSVRIPNGSRVVRVSGGKETSLSDGLAAAGAPCVRPDGKALLFVAREKDGDAYAVYECAADGSDRKVLVRHDTDCQAAAYLPDGRVQRVPRPGFSSRDVESGPHGAAVSLDLYVDVLDRRIGWVAEVQPDGGVSSRFISSPQTNSEFFTVAGDFVYQRTCVPDAQGRCGWRFDAARWR